MSQLDRRQRAAQRSSRQFSNHSFAGLEFSRRYLEALFDRLFTDYAATPRHSRWWNHVAADFSRAVRIRAEHVWRAGPTAGIPQHAFGLGLPLQLHDEAIWHVAASLKSLYETISWEDIPRGGLTDLPLIELSEDRDLLDTAAAALPAVTAESSLPARTWTDLFRRLALTAHSDFLLAMVQRLAGTLRLHDLVAPGCRFVQGHLDRRGSTAAEVWQTAWDAAVASAGAELSHVVDGVTLDDLELLITALVERLPDEITANVRASFD